MRDEFYHYSKHPDQEAKNALKSIYAAYHEAGHTVAMILKPTIASKLEKVTIVPDEESGGHVLSKSTALYGIQKSPDMTNRHITHLLAGHAATNLAFGSKIQGGTETDYDKAKELTTTLIDDHIMNANSTMTINEIIETNIRKNFVETTMLLLENLGALNRLTKALFEHKTLHMPEVARIIHANNDTYSHNEL